MLSSHARIVGVSFAGLVGVQLRALSTLAGKAYWWGVLTLASATSAELQPQRDGATEARPILALRT